MWNRTSLGNLRLSPLTLPLATAMHITASCLLANVTYTPIPPITGHCGALGRSLVDHNFDDFAVLSKVR